MNDTLAVAVIGLLGVLLGSALSTAASWHIERRRDRRSTAATVRLLSTDLHKAIAIVEPVEVLGDWGPERTELPTTAYEAGKDLLAGNLDPDTWVKVEGAILGVRRMEGIRLESLSETRPLTANELADADRIGTHLRQTITLLDESRWMAGIAAARQRAEAGLPPLRPRRWGMIKPWTRTRTG